MKAVLLCYERCSTCKKAEKWLNERGIDFESRSIVDQNPTENELKEWIEKSALTVRRFFNTSGIKYRELGLKDRVATESTEELIKLLATDGMLVKRPLLIDGERVIPGFREAEYTEYIESLSL